MSDPTILSPVTKAAAAVTEASAEHDISTSVEHLADTLTTAIEDAASEEMSNTDDAKVEALSALDTVRSKIHDGLDSVADLIKARPLESAAVLLGTGLLAGLFIAGSQRR